ncbi:hypothetical protein LVW27_28340, partial [Klebsiella pneumoniae]|nr:hypothetical protein [Klebsiella pneumoniae]
MGSCAAPSAKGDDKFITTDYLQQCPNFPLPPDTERIFERMVGLSLVKTDLSTPLHVRIQDPLNNEKG